MSEVIQYISEAIIGEKRFCLLLGGKIWQIQPPTIETIARMAQPLSRIRLHEAINPEEIADQLDAITEALALASLGSATDWKKRLPAVKKQMRKATIAELTEAFSEIVTLIIPKDFFVCATLAIEVAKLIAR